MAPLSEGMRAGLLLASLNHLVKLALEWSRIVVGFGQAVVASCRVGHNELLVFYLSP